MRIAVPTDDGTAISGHFGRSAAFLVFEIENGEIKSREMRTNRAQHLHDEGACGQSAEGHGQHSHAGILATLAGCQTVLCAGMGWRAAEALKSAGIAPAFVANRGSVEDAVTAYLGGQFSCDSEQYCRCGH